MKTGKYCRFLRSGFIAVICAAFQSQLFAFPVSLITKDLVNGTIEISKSPANTGENEMVAPLTAAGEYATVKATPDAGYEFDKWTIICMVFSGTTTQRQEFSVDTSVYTIGYSDYIGKYGTGLQMVQCKAAFKGKSIRVNLDVNNSSAAVNPTYKTVTVGSTYSSLPVPTSIGASFTGWFTEPDGGTLITSDTEVTEISEHTLYAHWQALNFTLSFNPDGGELSGAQTINVLYGATYPDLPLASRPGYVFKGWFTERNGAGAQIKKDANVSILSDTLLYAYWEPATYALSFAPQGGNLSSSEKVYVVYKGTYQNFPTATKGGYSLVGWYTAAEGGDKIAEGDSVLITEDVTLYARWAPITYTIAFDGNGSTSGSMSSISATYGSSYTLTANAFSRKYTVTYNASGGSTPTSSATSTYTFKNWNTASGGTGSTYANNASVKNLRTTSGTITLYAQWTSAAVTLPTPTRTGYTFAGWYTAASGGTKIGAAGASYTPTAAITLYAHWTANTYTIAFDGNGSTSGSMSSISAAYDTSYTLTANAFSRKYAVTYNANGGSTQTSSATSTYTFKNWNTASGGTGSTYANNASVKNLRTTSATITLYAQWASAAVTLPTPTRTGYTFAGWYTAAGGGTKIGAAGASYTPTKNITLYAHWTANTYTIAFDGNGSTSGSMSSISATYDSSYTLTANAFSREYTVTYNANGGSTPTSSATSTYTFKNWNTASGGTETSYANKASVRNLRTTSGTVTLYAQWTSAAVTLPTPTRTGYTFAGWYTAASGGTKIGAAGASYTPTKAITLYAHWEAESYTVTFDAGDGTLEGSETCEVTYAGEYPSFPTVSRAGYDFAGWYTSLGEMISEGDPVSITGDTTLYAHWTASAYTVFFDPDGGVLEGASSVSVTYGDPYPALPSATRTGYGFNGWYLQRNAEGDVIAEGNEVGITSNVTVYAAWTNNVYTVNFRKGGAFYGEEFSTNVFYDTAFELPENIFSCLDGSTFAGWELPGGTVHAAGSVVSNLAASGSVDVTAVWAKPPDPDGLNTSGVCKNLYVTTSSGDYAWTVYEEGGVRCLRSAKVMDLFQQSCLSANVEGAGTISFKYCSTGIVGKKSFSAPGIDAKLNNANALGFGNWISYSEKIESSGDLIWEADSDGLPGNFTEHYLYIKDVVWTPDGYTEESETFTYTDETGAVRTATVPVSWVDENNLLPSGSDDYRAALEASSGKKGADGTALTYWHDYVAGTDPNDPDDVFRITGISVVDGTVHLTWEPDLRDAAVEREYQVLGKASLSDPDESWAPTNSATRFFRVDVHLKE